MCNLCGTMSVVCSRNGEKEKGTEKKRRPGVVIPVVPPWARVAAVLEKGKVAQLRQV